jgi:hypothetical protein
MGGRYMLLDEEVEGAVVEEAVAVLDKRVEGIEKMEPSNISACA